MVNGRVIHCIPLFLPQCLLFVQLHLAHELREEICIQLLCVLFLLLRSSNGIITCDLGVCFLLNKICPVLRLIGCARMHACRLDRMYVCMRVCARVHLYVYRNIQLQQIHTCTTSTLHSHICTYPDTRTCNNICTTHTQPSYEFTFNLITVLHKT